MTTRAAVFWGPDRPFTVEEVDLRGPRHDEVVVRMAAAGICGTDLHSVRGEFMRPTPMVEPERLADIVATLLDHGYGEAAVRQILGENHLRVARRCWR